jgi:hypothetical protein
MSKRLIIEIRFGMVDRILCDGIDLTDVTALVFDDDVQDPEHPDLVTYGEDDAYMTVKDIEQADEETSRDIRRAYDTWALS